MGTITSNTLTVVFFLRTITAASATNRIVVYRGGMWKAFSKAEATELLMT